MQEFATAENRAIASLAAAVVSTGTLVFIWRAYRRRRARATLHAAIAVAGFDHMQDVLVPDGMGGAMHVDYLLLTSRGVLVVDLRDVSGNIFGGDQMTEWTVMDGAERSTFQNPQAALYDRVAAVKLLAGELPVEGRVLFTRRGKFPKGLPRWTMMVDSLRTEFPPADDHAFASWLVRYREFWENIRKSVTASPLKKKHPFLAEVFLE
ncbi:MAG: nuclease-related domain-containing protein [Pseudomonadota bacterium]